MKYTKLAAAMVACAALGAAAPSQAARLSANLAGGFNTFDDRSREMVFDNGDGVFSVGDVFVGLLKIDERTEPSAAGIDDQELYAVFSLQVESAGAVVGGRRDVSWTATTVAGLTLSDILGVPLPAQDRAGDALGVVFSDVGLDFTINQEPGVNFGDVDGSGQFDGLDYIHELSTNGTMELVVGFLPDADPEDDDFFTGNLTAGPLAALNVTTESTNIGTLEAGLSVLTNLTGRELLREVCRPGSSEFPIGQVGAPCLNFGAGDSKHDVTITGTLNGLANAAIRDDFFANGALANPGDFSSVTRGGVTYNVYGVGDDVSFRLAAVPEPATLAILGVSLLGLGFGRRASRRG
ncbi:MAG: PEP-CTERM sorting domain-containing protein [Chromatiales bacterium]|nr:PEP-CTERM sorting domain-containing protein [Chromatiales bacterium]